MLSRRLPHLPARPSAQRGLALVFVLVMMTITIVMAVLAARLTLLGERASRNDRDRQIAFQTAELALQDARDDIMNPRVGGRGCLFGTAFMAAGNGCSSDPRTRGVCSDSAVDDRAAPVYKNVNWNYKAPTSANSPSERQYVTYGEFTDKSIDLQIGAPGAPALAPKYIVVDESSSLNIFVPGINATLTGATSNSPVRGYRVYALGYGASPETQVMLEAVIIKPRAPSQCAGAS